MMNTLKPRTRSHRVPDGDGGVPGLCERAGHVLRPVDGLEGPDALVDGVGSALDLDAEAAPVLEPDG